MTKKNQKIQILPQQLINQIAAGEVIGRPASAVKELLENSIDAGATLLTITVANSCRNIKVTDDGVGMTEQDAALCFERHSTSKISTLEDLDTISSRGFRGEALASISSIAKVYLLTRHKDSIIGTAVTIEASVVKSVEQTGVPIGTSVFIRDIFYNTPARLKFLKSEKSEFNAILRIVTQQAISMPHAGITLYKEGKKVLELPKNQTQQDRIVQLIGSSLQDQLIPVELDLVSADLKISGFMSQPSVNFSSRAQFYFFVNGRPIRSLALGFAVVEGYKGYLMTKRYPFCAIFIEIPPDQIDVNVHPTKEEVRFKDERKVFSLLNRAVVECLRNAQAIGVADLSNTDTPFNMTDTPPPSSTRPSSPASPYPTLDYGNAPLQQLPPVGKVRFVDPNLGGGLFPKTGTYTKTPDSHPTQKPKFSIPTPQALEGTFEGLKHATAQLDTGQIESIDKLDFSALPTPVPLGQIANTYILAQLGNDLLLIDQHAAHERIIYNTIIDKHAKRKPTLQPLLIPITVEVPLSHIAYVDLIIPILTDLGIEIEEFGHQTFVIRTIPTDFEKVSISDLIYEIVENIELKGKPKDTTELKDAILTRLACHSAIKAGETLHTDEMKQLIENIIASQLRFTCPHGRPTMLLLTQEQLDKQFKRT